MSDSEDTASSGASDRRRTSSVISTSGSASTSSNVSVSSSSDLDTKSGSPSRLAGSLEQREGQEDPGAPNGQLWHFFSIGAQAIAKGRLPPALLKGAAWAAYCKDPRPDAVIEQQAAPSKDITTEQQRTAARYQRELAASEFLAFPPPDIAPLFARHAETTARMYDWLLRGAGAICNGFSAPPMVDDVAWAVARQLPRGYQGGYPREDGGLLEQLEALCLSHDPSFLWPSGDDDRSVLAAAEGYLDLLIDGDPNLLPFPPDHIADLFTYPFPGSHARGRGCT